MNSSTQDQSGKSVPAPSEPAAWLDNHGDSLYRYALLRLNDPAAAEDMLQETLLGAIKAQASFAGKSSERTWLLGIMKNKIVDHIRKCSRERPVDQDLNNIPDSADDLFDAQDRWGSDVSSWSHPDKSLQQEQFWPVFRDCISGLPEQLAQAFVFKEIDGMSSEEICQALDISSTNNLFVMLSRARMQLRQCLGVNWFDNVQEGNR